MKNIIRKGLTLAVCIGAVLASTVVFAVPAKPELFEHVQPDGSVIYARMWGDEFYNFVGDEDGYILTSDEDGTLRYVTADTSDEETFSAPSQNGRPANAVKGYNVPDRVVNNFDEDPGEDVDEVEAFSGIFRGVAHDAGEEDAVFASSEDTPSIFEQRLLIVIPEYDNCTLPDMWTTDLFDKTFFSQKSGVLSVANYYKEVSGGRLTFVPAFNSDDIGTSAADGMPITDDDTTDTYGVFASGIIRVRVEGNHPNGNFGQGTSNTHAKKILAALDPYIDISKFSNGKTTLANSDMSICFFMPGYEMSGNTPSPATWAHKTYLASGYAMSLDGVKVCTSSSGYIMVGSRDYNNNKDTASQLGVFCHELGHLVCKLPDLYNPSGDTDYSDISALSLMNHGSWGRRSTSVASGSRPTHLDAWSKYYLGWYDAEDLLEVDATNTGVYDLESWHTDGDGYKLIKVNSLADNEYFLIENRQHTGFDEGFKPWCSVPGIAVWRIDGKYTASSYVSANTVNARSNPGVKLLRSGKGLADFYNSSKYLWHAGDNKLAALGKATSPSNTLNTPPLETNDYSGVVTEITDSGVGFRVLSPTGNTMKVSLGHADVESAYYTSGGNTKMYVFNNTPGTISTVPLLAEYGNDTLNNLLMYGRVAVESGKYATTPTQSLTLNSTDYDYKGLLLDWPKLTSYYTDYEEPEEDRTYRLTLNNTTTRESVEDGMSVKAGSYVLFYRHPDAAYKNNGSLATVADGPLSYLVAVKIKGGTNVISAVRGDGIETESITVTGIKTDANTTATTSNLTNVTSSAGTIADTTHTAVYNVGTKYQTLADMSSGFKDGADYLSFKADVYYKLNSSSQINGSTGYSGIFGIKGSATKYLSIFDNGELGIGGSGTYEKTGIKLTKATWNTIEVIADKKAKSVDVYVNGVLAIKGYKGSGTITNGLSVVTGVVNSNVYFSNTTYSTHIINPDAEDDEESSDAFELKLNTMYGLANMASGENAVIGTRVEFIKPTIAFGNTVKYFNNGTDITDTVEDGNVFVGIPVTAKGNNVIKAVEYNGDDAVRETEEITIVGLSLTVTGKSGGNDELWPPETEYAAYLEEGAVVGEDELAMAQKLYGVVDGTATRKPAQGTGTASSSYTASLSTADYVYLRMNVFIRDGLTSATPWISRWTSDYIRINGDNNHILVNTSKDTNVTLRTNEWEKIEIYADGSTIDIYINGVLKGKKCATHTMTGTKIYLGSSSSEAEPNLYIDRLDYYRGKCTIDE